MRRSTACDVTCTFVRYRGLFAEEFLTERILSEGYATLHSNEDVEVSGEAISGLSSAQVTHGSDLSAIRTGGPTDRRVKWSEVADYTLDVDGPLFRPYRRWVPILRVFLLSTI